MYEFRNLADIIFSDIVNCMREAFSDYVVQMDLDEETLYQRFKHENVRYELSYGAFYEGRLVALLLNAIGMYKGKMVAFDAATGVIAEHRRKGISSRLMDYCKENLKEEGVHYYMLEVIQSNTPAVNAYQKTGLKIVEEFACFRGHGSADKVQKDDIIDVSVTEVPLESIEGLLSFSPSFENRMDIIKEFAKQYRVLYSGALDNLEAVIIYDADSGQVKQLGYASGKMNNQLPMPMLGSGILCTEVRTRM
ncbi:GNAT family N-acetyltransferase [Ohessyouella blattaphilus]|uniref:GNAT family N-acetyltransferase n=1 Tax=Ohessyouella blattaphilus TaxID=2949333 RepID=A0ABT1EGR5_9FIRM|nr:GNAT family N-acetyltransferase [Ohessyouella blattaphilus]MCP1109858.1 GNAT family N-acetyltransferase [Ohessyouella blattaphilus]MCR8563252.1 GNAT family N-acetyltransferase [Ohessyouella blattaphilus]